jgi:hypothetical protein
VGQVQPGSVGQSEHGRKWPAATDVLLRSPPTDSISE